MINDPDVAWILAAATVFGWYWIMYHLLGIGRRIHGDTYFDVFVFWLWIVSLPLAALVVGILT